MDIPQPLIARHPDAILSARELRSWLDELPAADPKHTIHQLQRQLAFLVRAPQPPRRYEELLQCYHEPVATLQPQALDALDTPQVARTRNQHDLLAPFPGLLQELASAHMRAAQMRLSDGKPPRAADLHAALLMLGRSIQHNMIEQQVLHPGTWRQMVQLYNVAERHGLGHSPCDNPLRLTHDPATANGAFFSALILLLSDPHRHSVGCIQQLVRKLPGAVDALHLSRETKDRYRIPVDLSGASTPLAFSRRPTDDGQAHKVYLHGLNTMLQQLPAEEDAPRPRRLRHWLATELGTLIAGRRERRHPRQIHNADYHFTQGLEAVHQRLTELQSQHERRQYSEEASLGGVPCRQNDTSFGGASFLLPARVPIPEPGEWLLFEPDQAPDAQAHSSLVAQMRWRLVDDNGCQHIGVERLIGHVFPVTLGSTRQPALLNTDKSHSHFQLVAPLGHFTGEGTVETLEGINKHYQVRHERRVTQFSDTEIIHVSRLD